MPSTQNAIANHEQSQAFPSAALMQSTNPRKRFDATTSKNSAFYVVRRFVAETPTRQWEAVGPAPSHILGVLRGSAPWEFALQFAQPAQLATEPLDHEADHPHGFMKPVACFFLDR
jgi:hypothetical protein